MFKIAKFKSTVNKFKTTNMSKAFTALMCFALAFSSLGLVNAASNRKEVDGPVIGIDLGTTYSCVGIFKNGRVEITPNEFGNRITPSFVAFTDEERLVGEAAKNHALLEPKRAIFVVKRLIGRKFDDSEVQKDIKWLPYSVVSKGGKPYVSIETQNGQKTLSPEEVSSMVLVKMK